MERSRAQEVLDELKNSPDSFFAHLDAETQEGLYHAVWSAFNTFVDHQQDELIAQARVLGIHDDTQKLNTTGLEYP
ncbi:hypothetical protein C5B42_00470 [Candidatus Cerribacteria bacterium 'Amazon FNV 2010 28 9']|uniref:Uncharacterized protein n=1 Tax=Candidatus Cerribacteria bacterium 'Amazon FNV 2010 28 9' TaxID=2081795 RepID=A0A317JSR7_9BACT|nr:MAG: hypothetical protein C5B42_00470 [Candidatus Cerribacteria bacterium 'Amazon FNV 2010 28 9']